MTGTPVSAFPTPCEAPNGLQWTDDGLWVVDQILDDAYLVDESGRVLRKIATPAENSSGVTFGDGHLWVASNGETTARPFRPTDTHVAAVLKLDPETGTEVARFPTPDGGGIHGIEWDDGLMWVTAFNPKAIYLVEPDTFKVLRSFLVDTERLHGLARDGDGIWCAHTTDKAIIKYHTESGEVMERIQLPQDGPAPHGLSIRGGELWYCDANFAGKRSHGTRTEGPEIGRIVSRQPSVDGKGESRLDQQAARHR